MVVGLECVVQLTQLALAVRIRDPNDGEPEKELSAVRGLFQSGSQVAAGGMGCLVQALLPEEAARYIVNFALVGYVSGYSTQAIIVP